MAMSDKIFLQGHCSICGIQVSGYSSKASIKNQSLQRLRNRPCRECKKKLDQQRRGRSNEQLMEARNMEACGCRLLSREEIKELGYV